MSIDRMTHQEIEAEACRLIAERDALLHVIQRHQPAGSPPPGGPVQLADWVLATLRQQLADVRAENDRLKEEAVWVRTKLGLPADASMFGGEAPTVAGTLHVVCFHHEQNIREVKEYDAARRKAKELEAERDKLQAFKDWVHNYLDAHGVPHHPPGTHGAAGCRIGDRMDWLMAELGHWRLKAKGNQAAADCADSLADKLSKTEADRDLARHQLAEAQRYAAEAQEALSAYTEATGVVQQVEYVDGLNRQLHAEAEAAARLRGELAEAQRRVDLATDYLLPADGPDGREVCVSLRRQPDGTNLWVVMIGPGSRYVLSHEGKWEYEPMPSHRTDGFIARTRYTWEAAWALAERAAKGEFSTIRRDADATPNP